MLFLFLIMLFVAVDPRNLPLKFSQNWISNSWDFDDFLFPVVVEGGGVKSFSCQTQLLLCQVELSWGWVGVVTIYGQT